VGKRILADADGEQTPVAGQRAHLRAVQIRIPMDDLKQIDSDLGAVERACAAARMLLVNTRFKQDNPDRVRRMIRSVFEALNHDINGTGGGD
jgi:hypothetical protein